VGTLRYGSKEAFPFEDRVLAHMKIAITTKLRRNEPFTLSWEREAAEGSGRSTLWISASIPLHFEFASAKPPSDLNRRWVEAFIASASSTSGMTIVPEPPAS
jgi:hypothetical protein